MSDKIERNIKLSVRVPKRNIDFLEKNGSFKSRSDFVNEAIDYFICHLETLKCFEGVQSRRFSTSAAGESALHSKLKHLGIAILLGRGCAKVDEEKPFLIDGRRVEVDVYGIDRNGKEIAIECWVSSKTGEEKLRLLKKKFNEIIILTPNDLLEYFEDLLRSYQETVDTLSAKFTQFKMPIPEAIRMKTTSETKVDVVKENTRVGKQLLPIKAIKEELLKGNLAMVKGSLKGCTLEMVHAKLRLALKEDIKGKFKIFSKYIIDGKDEGVLLELRHYPQ